MKSLLTIKEFAEKFSISRSQVYRILERQEIPLIKIGRAARIKVSDADAWLENLCQTQK